jgi:hypothetical protein
MNKIRDLICQSQKLKAAREQKTQLQLLIYTYVTGLATVKIEQFNQSICKVPVKDILAIWQVSLVDIGYY